MYLMCRVEGVEDVVLVILEPPGLPHLLDTDHVRGTRPELRPVQRDHPGPVTRVWTAGDTARQLIEVDTLTKKIL